MAGDFAWRKKELTLLRSTVYARRNDANLNAFIRSAVALLYAHWEGFVKFVGTSYLEFVARQHVRHCDLATNFLAVAMGRAIFDASTSKKMAGRIGIVDFFRNGLSQKSNIQWQGGVNTKANLGAAVLQEIILKLGLDYAPHQTKEKLIDEKLLRNRNHIAHGQYLVVGYDEYMDLHVEILRLMQVFYDQVEDAAMARKYLTTPPVAAPVAQPNP
ncbi:MAG: MAE_28990/MAE_18760 family HEPN-like nuclease [Pirellulales bacterium]